MPNNLMNYKLTKIYFVFIIINLFFRDYLNKKKLL